MKRLEFDDHLLKRETEIPERVHIEIEWCPSPKRPPAVVEAVIAALCFGIVIGAVAMWTVL